MTIDEIVELCKKSQEIGCADYFKGFKLKPNIFLKEFPRECWESVEKFESDEGNVWYSVRAQYQGMIFRTMLSDEEYRYGVSFVTYKPEQQLEYVIVKLDNKAVIQIKRGDEGYVLDVYGKDYDTDDAEPITSTYVFYSELEEDEDAQEDS